MIGSWKKPADSDSIYRSQERKAKKKLIMYIYCRHGIPKITGDRRNVALSEDKSLTKM
jgi:hypothetical protein